MATGAEAIQLNTKTKKPVNPLIDFSTVTDFRLGSLSVTDSSAIKTWTLGSTNGTKLGTTGDKIGFLGATPIVRPTGSALTGLSNLGLIGSPTVNFTELTGTASTGQIPALDTAKITTGVFALARIPTLDAGRIPDLDWSKIATGKPTTVAGYGIADFNTLGDARWPQLSGSYANPSWITSIPFSKLTSVPTTLSGYGITDLVAKTDAANTFVPLQTFNSLNSYAVTATQLSNPGAPSITNVGTAGGTTWRYRIVAKLADGVTGTAGGTAGVTTTGNATLDSTNKNSLTWSAVIGATSYDVYRTTAGLVPSTTGKIANVTSPAYVDAGAAGDSATVPEVNNTGSITGRVSTSGGLLNLNYLDVRWFDVDITGSPSNVTTNTTNFNLARAAARTANAVLYNPGVVKVNSEIAITAPERWFGGTLKWGGSAGTHTVLSVSTMQGDGVTVTLENLTVDANSLATDGVVLYETQFTVIRNMEIKGFTTGDGLKIAGSSVSNTDFSNLANVTINGTGDGHSCLYLTGDAANACHNTLTNFVITHEGSRHGVVLGNCDNNRLRDIFIYNQAGVFLFTADAGTNLLTSATHGLSAGNRISVESSGTLPGGLSPATNYYVIASGLTANDFKVSTAPGGSAVDITSAGTGFHSWSLTTGFGVYCDPSEYSGRPEGNIFNHLQAGTRGWYQPGSTTECPAAIYGYQTDNGQPLPVTNGTPLYPVTYNSGHGSFLSAEIASTLDVTGDVTSRGAIVSKNLTSGTVQGLSARDSNFDSNFQLTQLVIGGTTATGEFASGVSRANAAALYQLNLLNFVIGSNNACPVTIDSSSTTITGPLAVASITQDAVSTPSLLNGWSDFGSGYGPARYYKSRAGRVYLSGVIGGGTATLGTILFNLPVGYRPATSKIFQVNSAGAAGQIQIATSGNVQIFVGSSSDLCLDGVSFRTDT